ncbi:MAG: bacteriohemerythrin [Leptospira sp.]|nr:bacteriohemerythrin [Leptospira sp.]
MKIDEVKHVESLKKVWNSEPFSLGIPVIDLQHLWLVNLILKLEETLTDVTLGSFSAEIKSTFTHALEYVSEHFSLEEEILEHFNYPNFDQHVRGHRSFVAKLAEKFNHSENDEVAALGLLQILKKWLFQHILHEDSDYANFFKSKDVRLNLFLTKLLKENKYRVTKEQILLYKNISTPEEISAVETSETHDSITDIKKIWKTYNLSTNIPIIDLQHIWLLKIIVELSYALNSGEVPKDFLQKSINNVIAYTKDHFSVEDRIMRQFRFNDFANHMSQHKRFIEFVQLRHEENRLGEHHVASHLIQDLKNWLLSHIAFEDKKIGIAFASKVRELSEFTKTLHQNGEVTISAEQKNLYKAILQDDSEPSI